MTRAAQYPIQTNVLRYFLEIARCQSMRQAAEELNVAASALSRHVSNLEHELGVPLFERHARGLRITVAGEVVAAGARRALRQIERICSDVDDLRDLRRGQVSIYAVEGVVADFLLSLLSEFIRSYPRVTYDIVVGGTEDVIEALVDDQADIGVAFNLQPNSATDVICEAEHPEKFLSTLDARASPREMTERDQPRWSSFAETLSTESAPRSDHQHGQECSKCAFRFGRSAEAEAEQLRSGIR